VVEGLGRDLPCMIDAHQGCASAAVGGREVGFGDALGRRGAGRGRRHGKGPEPLVQRGDEAVRPSWGGGHGGHYIEGAAGPSWLAPPGVGQ
jgi:hypothetical protein